MNDFYDFSRTTPNEETCAQLGDQDYENRARIEAAAFIEQLKRAFGENPTGTRFQLTTNHHDAGIYIDVRFHFDDENADHFEYFDAIQSGVQHWDQKALEYLSANSYQEHKMHITYRAA